MSRRRVACALFLLAACRSDPTKPLGPPDSYRLFAPAIGATSPSGLLVVRPLDIDDPPAVPLVKVLSDGFGSEMLRTAFLAKQLVREARLDGQRFPETSQAVAGDALYLVLGNDRVSAGRGLAIERRFGGPEERPSTAWLGLGRHLDLDRALVQTVAGRLAVHAVQLVASDSPFGEGVALAPALVHGYRMAMEVIAREWRVGRGPQGVVPHDAGTKAQRELFARVRENRYVLGGHGQGARPAAELLAEPGVAATVIHRLAQTRSVAQRPAPDAFYAPFAPGRLPEGVSPAAVLGAFRNFQAKLLGAWATAAQRGRPPHDIVDLIETYAGHFPEERSEVLRVFLVTTLGATVKSGGVDSRDAAAATAVLLTLHDDVLTKKRSLRDAAAR